MGKEVLYVEFKSMWYADSEEENRSTISIKFPWTVLKVCYAMHSSLNEITKVIDYLEPKVVTPLVIPKNSSLKEVMMMAVNTVITNSDIHL